MKRITVSVAALGYGLLERNGLTRMAGLDFAPAQSVFPAVTCVAQASLRTGLDASGHGMASNGVWVDALRKPLFWEQNAALVKGRRIWADRRAAGGTVGLFFFQQSLGEDADVIVSPAPIHKHGGGMVMSCYAKPAVLSGVLAKRLGTFPLWRYWGPLASPKVGRACIDWFEAATEIRDVDEAYLYLPTLDYAAQKCGPDAPKSLAALQEFRHQLERVAAIAARRGAALSVVGEYEITPVTAEPVAPNVALRRAGLFRTRTVAGRAYPDLYQSAAFAMCDHEFCVLFGEKARAAEELLLATGDYVRAPECGGQVVLLAKEGGWCDYRWWTDRREAPDYASHVDIHNKPGYDPKELFFFNRGTIRGTHGRPCAVAHAEAKS